MGKMLRHISLIFALLISVSGFGQNNILSSGGNAISVGGNLLYVIDADLFNTKSILLDGGERVNLGTNDIIADGATSASYSLWVKTSSNVNAFLYGRYSGGNNATTPTVFLVSGIPRFYMGTSIANYRDGTTDISDGQWHHLLCVFVGGSKLDIYLDGVNDNGALTGSIVGSVPANNVGNTIGQNVGNASGLVGNLDEVGIFQADLSSNVAETYNGGKPTDLLVHSQSANLKGYWRLGDKGVWDGSNWSFPDQKGSNNGTSLNMELADVVTDTP